MQLTTQANVFIERLWRSLKYELIYPGDFQSGQEMFQALEKYFHFYNHQRPHQALRFGPKWLAQRANFLLHFFATTVQ